MISPLKAWTPSSIVATLLALATVATVGLKGWTAEPPTDPAYTANASQTPNDPSQAGGQTVEAMLAEVLVRLQRLEANAPHAEPRAGAMAAMSSAAMPAPMDMSAPGAGKTADPVLANQLAQLRLKMRRLEASMQQQGRIPPGGMPMSGQSGMVAGAPPAGATPQGGEMPMMMDKMMGMMDKMMGGMGGPMPAAPPGAGVAPGASAMAMGAAAAPPNGEMAMMAMMMDKMMAMMDKKMGGMGAAAALGNAMGVQPSGAMPMSAPTGAMPSSGEMGMMPKMMDKMMGMMDKMMDGMGGSMPASAPGAGAAPGGSPMAMGGAAPSASGEMAMMAMMMDKMMAMMDKKMGGGAAPAGAMGMNVSPPVAPSGGGMGMMPMMMDKMMGMMDKMMGGMGGPMPLPAPGAGVAPGGSAMPMGGGAAPPSSEMVMMAMMMDKMMTMMDKTMGGGPAPAPMADPAPSAGMGMMDDSTEMAGMMGSMGPAGGPATAPPSSLPGSAGASHLYHIGSTDFFLDHPQHIALSLEQKVLLNQIKERAALDKASTLRSEQDAEQDMWLLTAADQPNRAQIEAKIVAIQKMRGDERMRFIEAVGSAANVLTAQQRSILTGFLPAAPAAVPKPTSAPPMAAPMAAPMKKM